MSTPLRLVAVIRPTTNPLHRGHTTTYLYEEDKIPASTLKRMRDLPEELSWMEMIVGNLRLDPAESVRVQGELERACLPVHTLEEIKVPYHIVSIRSYPGRPVDRTLPWAIRLTIMECEIDPTVYLFKALPQQLVERVVKSGCKVDGLTYDPTNYTSVIFGDVPDDEEHIMARQEMLNKAEVPESELHTVVIALERTYLSH